MQSTNPIITGSLKKDGEAIKLPILIPLFASILLLLIIFTLAIYRLQQKHINEDVQARLDNVSRYFNQFLASDAQLIGETTHFVKDNPDIQNAWLAKNRNALLTLTTPIFEKLRKDYRITHLYFIDVNQTCFLRVHNPPRFGDRITRFTLKSAADTVKPYWGIELGQYGTFTLRVVQPWFVNNTLTGFVEFGEEIDHIAPQLKSVINVDLAFLIDKPLLNRDDWQEGLKIMGHSSNWDLMPNCVIADSTTSDVPPEFIQFASLPHEKHRNRILTAKLNGSTFSAGFVKLSDTAGHEVGDILVIKNITKEQASLQILLAVVATVSFLIASALVSFFYTHIAGIEKHLFEAHTALIIEIEKRKEVEILLRKHKDNLEDTVKERTGELEHTNKYLQEEIVERQKAENALRKSEERFKQVTESAGDWIWEVNAEGLYTYSSHVAEKVLGYKPEEIVGKKYFYDFFAPEVKEEFKKAAFEAFNKKERFNGFVNPNIHKNGNTVILETTATPILDDERNLCGYRGADRDITGRKRAEDRLLAVSELQKLLLPPVPIEQKLKFVTDSLVRILDADFARIWIIKPGDRCEAGCTHAEVKEGPHVCRCRDKCLHLMASSGRYTHLDGKDHCRVPFGCYKIGLIAAGERDKFLTNEAATDPQVHNHAWVKELGLVSFAGYRLTHTDGTPLGVMALFSKHPVSPEKDALLEGIANSTSMVIRTSQIEENLRKNEEFTRRVIESSSDCIKILDLQGHLLSMNEGGQKLLDIDDMACYLNSSFIDFWKGKEREGCLEALSKAKRGDTGIFYGNFATAKGTPKSWEVIVTPIKDADGSINRLLAVSRDITKRKKAEESIEKLNADLESTITQLSRTNKQLNEFAHLAAHDLKTPLRGIGTLAQWLYTDYYYKFDENGHRQIDLLVKRVRRMDNIINAILQYSSTARDKLKERKVDLDILLKAVIDKINPPENIKITINKTLPVLVCEEEHLWQIFRNLISNAVKFSDKPQTNIIIDVEDEKHFWKFSVADNGPGIEPQHFERIFRLFQMLNNRDDVESEGIGLTLTKKIVELYDGKIWLTSKVGVGSTFFFTLPKQMTAIAQQTPQPAKT